MPPLVRPSLAFQKCSALDPTLITTQQEFRMMVRTPLSSTDFHSAIRLFFFYIFLKKLNQNVNAAFNDGLLGG